MLIEPAKLFEFWVASVVLTVCPGPDTLYVLGRSIGQGRKAGVISTFSVTTGHAVHTLLTTIGVAAILKASESAFATVKLLGALYLAYLGIKLILSKPDAEIETKPAASNWTIYRQGLLNSILNPKVSIFFLAFIPQFVDPHGRAPTLQFVTLAAVFAATATCYLLIVATTAGELGDWLRRNPKVNAWQKRIAGGLFVGMAAKLALSPRS